MGEPGVLTPEKIEKVVTEELPVIAQLFGDETQAVIKTVDDLISKGVSQQIQEEITSNGQLFQSLNKKIVEPPYDPLKLAMMLELNTRLMRACHIRARNTVGLGWKIVKPAVEEDEQPVTDKEFKAQKAQLKPLFENPNKRVAGMPPAMATPLDFTEVSFRMKFDEEAMGTAYYEVTRDNAGRIDGIYNIADHTVRALKAGGYVQIRGGKKRFFKHFGDPRVIDSETGEIAKNLGPAKRATELLPNFVYSSRSSYYGIPRWISAVAAIQGSRLSAIRNISFFENDAVGRLAIVVSGGALTQQSAQDIRNFVNREGKGVEKAHRVMVLQAEPRRVISAKGVGTKIDIVPLTVGINEDASFLGYRKSNDEEVREASGLSSPFFTSEGVNRASANVLRKITIEQDLIPDLNSHQNTINRTITRDILTQDLSDKAKANFHVAAELRYIPPDSIDELEEATIQGMYSRAGLATINEGRQALGLPKLPPKYVYGQLPLPLAISMLELGYLYQGAIAPDGPVSWDDTQANMLEQTKKVEQAKASAKAEFAPPPAKKGSSTARKSMNPLIDPLRIQKNGHINQLLAMAVGLRDYLKEKYGRDILSAELILQKPDGEVLDRMELQALEGEGTNAGQ